ncbi:MAG: prepilin-type N-terminal cleavage/methylation domain-containing protein [Phycisphaerae bacterium]|nr:prepilin-type N-terminal cleavage/methylation domain-containing protein [Phycisphaerae bacterium]
MLTRRVHSARRSGFTLIELLTVVGIIALLIGILMPSLSRARDQAKRTKVAKQLDSIGTNLEMFQNDFGQYPDSSLGADPLLSTGLFPDGRNLSGAHWLARAMVGYDTKGVDAKGLTLARSGTCTTANFKDRKGPYVEAETYRRDNDTEKFQVGSDSDFVPTQRMVLFEDSYKSPVLYYRAKTQAEYPFTAGDTWTGVYSLKDNQEITGSTTAGLKGWNFTGQATIISGKNVLHRLGIFGATRSGTVMTLTSETSEPQSFARTLYSESSMKVANVLKPVRPDSFVLITAGKDGVFGTADDVSNIKAAN